MANSMMYLSCIFAVLTFARISVGLVAQISPVTLIPSGLAYLTAVYDGNDIVYLLGGDTYSSSTDQILKFNVSADSIELVANFPVPLTWGSAVLGGDGNIYYFGGAGNTAIWKFSPSDNSVEKVGEVPFTEALKGITAVSDGGDNVYIFGYPSVIKFDISSQTATIVNEHTSYLDGCSVWSNGQAYIFGGTLAQRNSSTGDYTSNEIWRFTGADNSMELVDGVRLADKVARMGAAWDGTNAYLIGGYGDFANNLMVVNPATNSVTTPPVTNMPTAFFDAASVYVQKLNRVYTFGGGSSFGPKLTIFFIDLDDSLTNL